MDLMYLPDAFTFHVIRSPPSREPVDYVEAWREDGRCGGGVRRRGERAGGGKASPRDADDAAADHRARKPASGGRDSCPICRERKRRTLAAYIRTKSRQDSETTIEEEEPSQEGNPTTEPQVETPRKFAA